jgi:aspartate/methionine/tyrosine aminotransferase
MAQVKMAGGTPVFVPLRAAPSGSYTEEEDLCANTMFTLDFEELERAITPKTKALILNTPHNPTGKMFTREELTQIANIIKRNPHVIIIADEVSTCIYLYNVL